MTNKIDWDCLEKDTATEITAEDIDTCLEELAKPMSHDLKLLPRRSLVDPLDVEHHSNLLPWDKVESFKKLSEGFNLVTVSDCKEGMSMAMQARKLASAVDKKRKEITRPALDFQKGIKKIADAFIDELKAIEDSLTEKVNDFNAEREAKSMEMGIIIPIVDEVEDGSCFTKEVWEHEITNLNEVPREYLMVNTKAIKAAVKDGTREIPGVKIFKSEKKQYRVKNTK